MVLVTVRTIGHLTSIIGGHQAQVDSPGAVVEDLLKELVARFGTPMRNFLHPRDEELSDMLFVLVNGRNIAHMDGTKTSLKDGDVVSILPITAGG